MNGEHRKKIHSRAPHDLFAYTQLIRSVQGMADVEVSVRRLECVRFAERDEPEVTFDVNGSLTETDRRPDSLMIEFSIDIETQPALAKINLAGSAVIRGAQNEVQDLLSSKDQGSVPPIFMKIYQKIYSVIYLLAGSVEIPQPAPNLLRTTKVYPSKEISPVAIEANPLTP